MTLLSLSYCGRCMAVNLKRDGHVMMMMMMMMMKVTMKMMMKMMMMMMMMKVMMMLLLLLLLQVALDVAVVVVLVSKFTSTELTKSVELCNQKAPTSTAKSNKKSERNALLPHAMYLPQGENAGHAFAARDSPDTFAALTSTSPLRSSAGSSGT